MKQAQVGFILILIIVAGVAGYLFYQNQLPPSQVGALPAVRRPVPPPAVPPSPTPAAPLTVDERAALTNPGPKATAAEQKTYFELVKRVAKSSSTLDISTCTPNPVVLRIKKGGSITVVNRSSIAHTISVDAQTNIAVPPQSSKDAVLAFERGPGIYGYGYGCDTAKQGAGLFFVVTE